MSRTSQQIAHVAIRLALLIAASPLAAASPIPVNGVRTALELIARKQTASSSASPGVAYVSRWNGLKSVSRS